MKYTHTYQNEELKQRGWDMDASHNSHMILFIAKNKRVECPYELKEKLQLMNGSLIRLSQCSI
jgi:hypothetical protein